MIKGKDGLFHLDADEQKAMSAALELESKRIPHPLEQRVEQLEALLRQAECPNTKNIMAKCIGGTITTTTPSGWECFPMPCNWCAKRDELLTSR